MERSKFARKGETAAKASSASDGARDSLCSIGARPRAADIALAEVRFQRVLRGTVSGAPTRALRVVRIKRCREQSTTKRISLSQPAREIA